MVPLLTHSSAGTYGRALILAACIVLTAGFDAAGRNLLGDENKLVLQASVTGSQVTLRWQASAEKEPGYFVLQRSLNGKEYSDVAMIISDTSLLENSYTYTETYTRNISARIYYRIKMVKSNGGLSFSSVRTVKFRFANAINPAILPNFITSELRINAPRSSNLELDKPAMSSNADYYVVRITSATERYN